MENLSKLIIRSNNTYPIIDFDSIRKATTISQGTYGEVWLLIDQKNQKEYAMKVFREIFDHVKIEREIELNKKLTNIKNSQNYFIKCYGDITFAYYEDTKNNISDDKIGLLFEKADGSLSKILSSQQKLSFDEIINILKCINDGLLILQQNLQCSHLDIKPGNILFETRKNDLPKFKLIDYGETLFTKSIGTLTKGISVVGTQHYFSPEFNYAYFNAINADAINTYKSDVYSLALTIMEISLMKKLKFPQNSYGDERLDEKFNDPKTVDIGPYDHMFKNYLEEIKIRYEHPGNIVFCELLQEMIKYNYNNRPSLIEIELKIRKIIEIQNKFLEKTFGKINNLNEVENGEEMKKEMEKLYEERDNLMKNNEDLGEQFNKQEELAQKIKRKYDKIKLENQILLEKIDELKKNQNNFISEDLKEK